MNSSHLLLVIIAVYCIFVVLPISNWEMHKSDIITPRYFYDKGLNWFGSILVFVLLCITSPILFVMKIFIAIYKIIKWVLTVGR